MAEFLLCDTATGVMDCWLPVVTGTWSDRVGEAETIRVTLDLMDPAVMAMGLKERTQPTKVSLIAVENGVPVAGGPIWTRDYDRPTGSITLGAKGMLSLFDHRFVLPVEANTVSMVDWTVPDPDTANNPNSFIPNPSLTTEYWNQSHGTIMKKLIEQSEEWPGGGLPLSYEDDCGGGEDRTYLGIDFTPISEALFDLNRGDDGVEMNFKPYFSQDGVRVKWKFQTGSDSTRIITDILHSWDMTEAYPNAYGLTGHEDGSNMGGIAFVTGGRRADRTIVVRAKNSALVDAGYPLMMHTDTKHTTDSSTSRLTKHAQSDVAAGKRPETHWTVSLRGFPTSMEGLYMQSEYKVGDFVNLIFAAYDPATGLGDPWMPDAVTRKMRIMAMGGDELGLAVDMDLAPEYLTGNPCL